MSTPSSSRPSPFADAVDVIMQRVAVLTADPLRAQAPYYSYGQENLDKTKDRPPTVRTYLGPGGVSQSTAKAGAGSVGNLFIWRQDVVFRVWGKGEKQCFDEATNIIRAAKSVLLASGSAVSITDVEFTWLEDLVGESKDGKKMEFTLRLPVVVPNTPSQLVTLTAFSGSISGSLTSSIPTTGSIGYPISGSWSPWKDHLVVSSSL